MDELEREVLLDDVLPAVAHRDVEAMGNACTSECANWKLRVMLGLRPQFPQVALVPPSAGGLSDEALRREGYLEEAR